MENSLAVIQFALSMEKEGELFFAAAAEQVQDGEAKTMFLELSQWEKTHQEFLQEQYDSLSKKGKWSEKLDMSLYDQESMKWSTFYRRGSGEGPEPTVGINTSTTDLSALRLAMFIETDLYTFYQNAATHTAAPEGKKILLMLAEWELNHRKIIESYYEETRQSLWSQMGFAPF
ncbi:MAG: Rubrerythrin [Firmicutes bacterium]|nr:Rubrerythrin [Bacillota bacterium]